MQRNSAGFTLIELMLVVLIFSILAAIAMPNLYEVVRGSRLASETNHFMGVLQKARSEAIRRALRVTLCTSADGVNCVVNALGWEQGWIMFVDADNSATRNPATEPLIVSSPPVPGFPALPDYTIRGNGTMADYISYVPSGMTRTNTNALQAGTIRICDNRYQGKSNVRRRDIIINAAGRARVAAAAPVCP